MPYIEPLRKFRDHDGAELPPGWEATDGDGEVVPLSAICGRLFIVGIGDERFILRPIKLINGKLIELAEDDVANASIGRDLG